jgi:putative heme-binding domain-containing protein
MILKKIRFYLAALVVLTTVLSSCTRSENSESSELDKVAANEAVADYLKAHEGRGVLTDDSKPTAPKEALSGFRFPNDLALDLVLSEPTINQPLHVNFDHRGRLWVIQYHQYPYPEGLKITGIDNHLRAQFDKVPQPPPSGVRGADKITFFEDTNGDGTYNKATDAITGLNIATSVVLGRKKVWVLNPPYLLAYPDPESDGLPNGPPVVHLKGFGLEDTHSVANSLHWGPDGWLYGAQGSTTTANINSSVSKNVSFQGMAIWRYHPHSEVFEIFAEGGANNAFNVEIDAKGRIYSGSNGYDRGPYYKQGAYYLKSWGKHGPLTNPYAFGYLPNMVLDGEKKRFTHAIIKYEGGTLPARYHGNLIAVNPLQNYVQLTGFEPTGSTFSVIDKGRILQTDDHWFRPVDINAGPDGAVYIADWYDSRLSHVDPRDTWHKGSGRIYRLRAKNSELSVAAFDLSTYSNDQLIALLSHKNKWFRQQALVQLGDRKDRSIIPRLITLLKSDTGQTALELLWAINLSGGFDNEVAVTALRHADPFVRMWAVRLSGDRRQVSPEASSELSRLASREPHPEVRSQLASTAKRLPASDAVPIINNLLTYHDDSSDPDIPLLIWWAIESKAEKDRHAIISIFGNRQMWNNGTIQKTILKRLMQRYTMAGGEENFASCTRLLALAPSTKQGSFLVEGLQEGLHGRDMAALPPDLLKALKPYQKQFGEGPLALALRQGEKQALSKGLGIIGDNESPIGERLAYIRIIGEVNQPESVPVLLTVMASGQSSVALRKAALQSLQGYDNAEIGRRVAKAFPNTLRYDPDTRDAALALLVSRPDWAQELLNGIDLVKQISKERQQEGDKIATRNLINKEDVPEAIVRQLKLLNDPAINATVDRLWPGVRLATSDEKSQRIARVFSILKSARGNAGAGRSIFTARCGSCHRLFDNGGNIGPDLTGYDRRNINDLLLNIVDPNADIREGYVNYLVNTKDGRTLAGTVTSRSTEEVTLQPVAGEAITLAMDQIKDIKAQPISLMPERLLGGLTDKEIRDLFAYLTKNN